MEPEDNVLEDLPDPEELIDYEEISYDGDQFDEHMNPYDEDAYYLTIDEY